MGAFFINIFKKITVLNSILMVVYCIFHPNLGNFEFMFITIILLLVSWIIWLIGKMLNLILKNKHPEDRNLKTNGIVRTIYLRFCENIEMIYSIFFLIYIVFHRKQIAVAYLILLMFGLYIGNRIAMKANRYLLDQANKGQKK